MKGLIICLASALLTMPAHAGKSIEPELCYQKILAAYQQAEKSGGFELQDNSCLKYKEYYDFKFRDEPFEHPRIIFTGEVIPARGALKRPMTTDFRVSHVYEGPKTQTFTIHHGRADFEFFPGEHLIEAYKNNVGQYVVKGFEHGEIVSYSERQRLAQLKQRVIIEPIDEEKELCFLIIKQAYAAEVFLGEWKIEESECEMHLEEYNSKFRVRRKQD